MAQIKNLTVAVSSDHISYDSYPVPFPPLKDLRSVPAKEIELLYAGFGDYQLLLRNGSVLFFPIEKQIALRMFVRRNNISVIRGVDSWSLLTEPFLDQEFTKEETERTNEILANLGFAPAEVKAIRRKVGGDLFRYNFLGFVWEWVSMGLLEVLYTRKPCSEDYARWAFSISGRGFRHAKPFDLLKKTTESERENWLEDQFVSLFRRKDVKVTRQAPVTAPAIDQRPWWKRLLGSKKEKEKGRSSFDFHSFSEQRKVQRAVFDSLLQHYSEPHRRYHNEEHLEQVISLLDSFWPQVTGATLMAGWFHDAIYVPGANDNEERSVTEMEQQVRSVEANSAAIGRAGKLIRYTKAHLATENAEEQMIHDADLGIFGMDHESYAQYAADIRREYSEVPDGVFKQARIELLENLQRLAEKRGRWFYLLDPIFEHNVAANLEWELDLLRK